MTRDPIPGIAYLYQGLIQYGVAQEEQERFAKLCSYDGIPRIMLFEPHHTVTYGKDTQEGERKADGTLRSLGINTYDVNRAGKATYHGPGQIVAYVIREAPDRAAKLAHIRSLEEALMSMLADIGVHTHASQDPHHPGIWYGDKKLAAIGVGFPHINGKTVTQHGLALNVATDISKFNLIYPCGSRENLMTSLANIIQNTRSLEQLVPALIKHYGDAAGITFEVRAQRSAEDPSTRSPSV